MVFQNYALYPQMTVSDNIGIALKLAKEVQLVEALGAELLMHMAIDAPDRRAGVAWPPRTKATLQADACRGLRGRGCGLRQVLSVRLTPAVDRRHQRR